MSQKTLDTYISNRMTSPFLGLIRAKSSDAPSYLLRDHVIEALKRCVTLYQFISSMNSLSYEPLKDEDGRREFFKALAKAVILHDLGKISYDFQKRLYGHDNWKELEGLLRDTKGIKVRHEILSLTWTVGLLGNSKWDAKIRTAILLHHYNEFFSEEKSLADVVLSYKTDVTKYLRFLVNKQEELKAFIRALYMELGKQFDEGFIQKALEELNEEINFSRFSKLLNAIENWVDDLFEYASMHEPERMEVDFLVFLGMLRRCDYSSSGNFSVETVQDFEAIFEDVDVRIINAIKEKNIRFEGLWQAEILKRHNDDYLIVVAPTGSGKTELAVLWAKNRGKLIYTLPLRVALNDLYKRLSKEYFPKELPRNRGTDWEEIVGLLHSTAFMEYVEGAGSDIEVEKKVNSARMLAMPVMLSTPDQVFLTGLNYYGSDKVISVYPESAIVVDEIQAYTPEMAAVFLKTLQLIQKAGGRVLIITATLPPFVKWFLSEFPRDEVERLGVNIEKFQGAKTPNFSFKVIDVLTEAKKSGLNVKNLWIKRHRIEIIEESLFSYEQDENSKRIIPKFVGRQKVEDKLREFESKGLKTIMIVVNNVRKAIEMYKAFNGQGSSKTPLEGWDVYLLHSRLPEIRKEQTIKEVQKILKRYRDSRRINKPLLLITTQVVEASIDVDFDAMITEISPIDSQVQRWGRVYRNRSRDYDNKIPNIIVFSGAEIDRGTISVYGQGIGESKELGKKVLEKTVEVLKELNGQLLDYWVERTLIEKVYSGEILERYIYAITELLEKLDYFTLEKKSEAQRVFRQMGGMYFVVPALMKSWGRAQGDKLIEKFGEILSNNTNLKLSWEEIAQKLSQEVEREVNKWELKKILQEFSVNVPIWFVLRDHGLQHALHNTTFKGYPVVLRWQEEATAEELWEYGVDEVINKDLDVEEDML